MNENTAYMTVKPNTNGLRTPFNFNRSIFTIISTILMIFCLFSSINAQSFQLQQLPMNSTSTQLEFHGHFICDSSYAPCSPTWNFTWTGFNPYQDTYPTQLQIYIFDLQTYNFTTIEITEPEDLLYYTTLLEFDIPDDDDTPYTIEYAIYGYLDYSTPIPQNISSLLFRSLMSIHVHYSRYGFQIIPGLFNEFAYTGDQRTLLDFTPMPLDLNDNISTSTNDNISISTMVDMDVVVDHNHPPTRIQNQNEQETEQQGHFSSSLRLPSQSPYSQFLAPAFTFSFPFDRLDSKTRETVMDPVQPPVFNRIYLYLFGYSKWTPNPKRSTKKDDKLFTNIPEITPKSISADFPKLCMINSIPISVGIESGSQSQALVLLIDPVAYSTVFRPMINLNQTSAQIHCNNNMWIYYHYNGDNDPQLIPQEAMSVVFVNSPYNNNNNNNTDNVENVDDNKDNNTDGDTDDYIIYQSVSSSGPHGSTWLWVAQVFYYSRQIYTKDHQISVNQIAQPTVDSSRTNVVWHTALTLPWDNLSYSNLDLQQHEQQLEQQSIPSWQKEWVQCNFSFDWSDQEFLRHVYTPELYNFTIKIDTGLSYGLLATPHHSSNSLSQLNPKKMTQALLVISPSSDLLTLTNFTSRPLSWFLPLSYLAQPYTPDGTFFSAEYQFTTLETLHLNENLRELFPSNKTDYTYLEKQHFSIYYPINRILEPAIDSTSSYTENPIDELSWRCKIQVRYDFEPIDVENKAHHKEENQAIINNDQDSLHVPQRISVNMTSIVQTEPFTSTPFPTNSLHHGGNGDHDEPKIETEQVIRQTHHVTSILTSQSKEISKFDQQQLPMVQGVKFILMDKTTLNPVNNNNNNHNSGLQLHLKMDLVYTPTNSKLQYITIHPITGLHFFTTEVDFINSSQEQQKQQQSPTCTISSNSSSSLSSPQSSQWSVVVMGFESVSTITSLRFGFIKGDTVDPIDPIDTTAPVQDDDSWIIISCPTITMVQTFPLHHTATPPTPTNDLISISTDTTTTTIITPQDINIYPPFNDNVLNLYDTLLFSFQFINSTHYNILNCNIINPYPGQPPTKDNNNKVWVYIVAFLTGGFCFLAFIALFKKSCTKNNNNPALDDTGDQDFQTINGNPYYIDQKQQQYQVSLNRPNEDRHQRLLEDHGEAV